MGRGRRRPPAPGKADASPGGEAGFGTAECSHPDRGGRTLGCRTCAAAADSAGLGFTAVVVATRESFVEQFAVFHPDVILSDFHLPGFSGETALKIAKEECPLVPFIFWSGVLGDEAAVALIKKGATDYVLKDRPARLPSVIRRALAEAEQRAQLAQLDDSAARGAAAGQPRPAGRRRTGGKPHPPAARRRPSGRDGRRSSRRGLVTGSASDRQASEDFYLL